MEESEPGLAGGGGAVSGVDLFVGGHAGTVQGERENLTGLRSFTSVHPPQAANFEDASEVLGMLDSGAFTDPPDKRLTPDLALIRQLKWEEKATRIWKQTKAWQSHALVSYDLLIDETWTNGERHKRRWSIKQAEKAVIETVEAAKYLASQREKLNPRHLILSAQGVDALQYAECSAGVLQYSKPGDWFGLGGWCILGRFTSYLPVFWQTIRLVLPMVKVAGLKHIHIFGVLYQPALGGLLHLADEYGISVSTDSTAPILACTWKDKSRSGARCEYWRDNVAWWVDTLANLRSSKWYKSPPDIKPTRQLTLKGF